MAIVPQRRISKTRKRKRRSHFKLDMPSMMVCPNCGEMKLAHIVCKKCGFYDGKLVREIKVKEEAEAEVAETPKEKKSKKKEKATEDKKAEKKTAKKKESKKEE
jgi:large subunit ribosomal protein L32